MENVLGVAGVALQLERFEAKETWKPVMLGT